MSVFNYYFMLEIENRIFDNISCTNYTSNKLLKYYRNINDQIIVS